jgi:DASH complex subunit SPC19
LEAAQAHPNRITTGATAAQKMEARRLQLLIKQRERLEADVRALDEEILLLVCSLVLVVAHHLT